MKTSQWEVENYRRVAFHELDKHFAESNIVMHRSEHFIQRLNLRSTNQIETIRAFIYAAKRAMTIPVDVKTSILINNYTFLFRLDENKIKDYAESKVLMCITFGQKPHHFANAGLKLTMRKA